MDSRNIQFSKFLSFVLRHRPEEIGIKLDSNGWVSIADLLNACAAHGKPFSLEDLGNVVANNNKKRFALSEDGQKIRASQGHSIDIELGYDPVIPPELLYHGTATRFLKSIRREGLVKGSRHHVHLSADIGTALSVGSRHGKAVLLKIRAGEMAKVGFAFYLSANGVWLVERIPFEFIEEFDQIFNSTQNQALVKFLVENGAKQ